MKIAGSSLREDLISRSKEPKRTAYELSLMKRFDRFELKTPASAGILSSVRPPKKFGLTPIIEDLAELDLSSVKRKSKDDFGLQPKTPQLLEEVRQVAEAVSEKKQPKDEEVAK